MVHGANKQTHAHGHTGVTATRIQTAVETQRGAGCEDDTRLKGVRQCSEKGRSTPLPREASPCNETTPCVYKPTTVVSPPTAREADSAPLPQNILTHAIRGDPEYTSASYQHIMWPRVYGELWEEWGQ
jgi:hypothetical protein